MSYPPDGFTDEQVRALREAARLVSEARSTAADMLARAGIDQGPEPRGSLDFCTGVVSFGPPARPCGCPGFRGDADFCFSQYRDFTGPDIGAGAIIRVCGHPREDHEAIWRRPNDFRHGNATPGGRANIRGWRNPTELGAEENP